MSCLPALRASQPDRILPVGKPDLHRSHNLRLERRQQVGGFEFKHPEVRIELNLTRDVSVGSSLIDWRGTRGAHPGHLVIGTANLRQNAETFTPMQHYQDAAGIRIALADHD